MKRTCTFFSLLILTLCAQAQQPGTPDQTFGTGGVTRTLISGDSSGAVRQTPDGKLIIANSYFIFRRMFADGTPDASYGTNGVATVSFPNVLPGSGYK